MDKEDQIRKLEKHFQSRDHMPYRIRQNLVFKAAAADRSRNILRLSDLSRLLFFTQSTSPSLTLFG